MSESFDPSRRRDRVCLVLREQSQADKASCCRTAPKSGHATELLLKNAVKNPRRTRLAHLTGPQKGIIDTDGAISRGICNSTTNSSGFCPLQPIRYPPSRALAVRARHMNDRFENSTQSKMHSLTRHHQSTLFILLALLNAG